MLATSISAGLVLIALMAQRTGMPMLSQQHPGGIERIRMLRLRVKQLEDNLAAAEKQLAGLRHEQSV